MNTGPTMTVDTRLHDYGRPRPGRRTFFELIVGARARNQEPDFSVVRANRVEATIFIRKQLLAGQTKLVKVLLAALGIEAFGMGGIGAWDFSIDPKLDRLDQARRLDFCLGVDREHFSDEGDLGSDWKLWRVWIRARNFVCFERQIGVRKGGQAIQVRLCGVSSHGQFDENEKSRPAMSPRT